MLARMQKQTSRAQHRTNIRERYGLQPDMLDTGTRFYLCEIIGSIIGHRCRRHIWLQKYW